ncbi:MAG: tetratricopeptide repeat protein [Thioploca sp.]|nr:tetratricopeptide repeat protein [Thioploca sp.]
MSELALYFLIYVMLFRLAIIAAGITSIVLGYRLFCKGIWGDKSGEGANLNANLGNATVTFQNAAPGTFFALFGVITIGFMFINSPEFSSETLQQVTPKISETLPTSDESQPPVKMILRGEQNLAQALEEQVNSCQNYYEKKQIKQSISTCRQATSVEALNLLAWMYQEQNQLETALPLAQAAIALDEKYTEALHTLAVIWCKKHDYEKAIQWLNQAIVLEPNAEIKQQFTTDLANFHQQKCDITNTVF